MTKTKARRSTNRLVSHWLRYRRPDVAGGPAVRLIELPGAEAASAVQVSPPLPEFLSPSPASTVAVQVTTPLEEIKVLINDTIELIHGRDPVTLN